jgi:colanic acid biosynthesis glycosyl transferase WcaI
VHPFPTDKRSIPRRAVAFGGFSALAGLWGLRGGRADGVLAMSPPLTLGLTGRAMATARRAPLVFNIQDVFPDVAVELGAISNERVIDAARRLERASYRAADAVTVLSDDLRDNVAAKLPPAERSKVRVIPNFVDTAAVRPLDRMTSYRRQLGIGAETVVMYAGNVGLSQSLELILAAAEKLSHREDIVFVVNGGGSARPDLARRAVGMTNVRFADYQPSDRLAEVLATGDVHVVPLKRAWPASVPSRRTQSGRRPPLAPASTSARRWRVVGGPGAGVAVAPEDPAAFRRQAPSAARRHRRPGHGRRRPGRRAMASPAASPGPTKPCSPSWPARSADHPGSVRAPWASIIQQEGRSRRGPGAAQGPEPAGHHLDRHRAGRRPRPRADLLRPQRETRPTPPPRRSPTRTTGTRPYGVHLRQVHHVIPARGRPERRRPARHPQPRRA